MRVTWELWENESYGIVPIIPIILALEKKRFSDFVSLCPSRVVALELFQPFKSVHTCVRR